MPRPPQTKGNPNDIAPVQVKMPLWLKRRALERAKSRAKDLSEYIRGLILADVGDDKR